MAAVAICSDFGAHENKICHCFHFFLLYLPWGNGTRCNDLRFFSCSIRSQLFNSPLWPSSVGCLVPFHFLVLQWYHLHIWGCWYFSWKSWFQLVLQPAWHFSWCTLHIKLNKQGDNIHPWRTPFPIWNQSVVPCPVLTVASWSVYRFFRRQVRWSGIPNSLRIFHSLL